MEAVTTYEDLKRALATLQVDTIESVITITLTPELAEAILSHDPVNRKLRPAKVAQFARNITAGNWRASRALALSFDPSGRLQDGQHRCHAVIAAATSIPVQVRLVSDTYGVDEGAPRTLNDYLDLSAHLDRRESSLAALVTRTLCPVEAPSDEELMAFFQENNAFILECVQKPLAWLSEHEPAVSRAVKPTMLATVRAKAIHQESLPAEAVDDLLYDVVNNAIKGGPGSYAEQITRALWIAYRQKSALGTTKILAFVKGSIEAQQTGAKIKNIITTVKRRKKTKTGGLVSPERLAVAFAQLVPSPTVTQ